MPSLPPYDANDRQPDPESIALRAAQLWQQAGGPPDRDVEFWLGAELELKAVGGQPPGGAPTAADGAPVKAAATGTPKPFPGSRPLGKR
ncbi:MAG: DUF2934 domain-containing protein [Undibacterium sp.]|nr:DUF2934 domain-containing protein [Opitutaceae bacterium]